MMPPDDSEQLAGRLIGQLRQPGGLEHVLRTTGPELALRYRSTQAIFVVRNRGQAGGYVWRCSHGPGDDSRLASEVDDDSAQRYFSGPEGSWLLMRQTHRPREHAWRLLLHDGRAVAATSNVVEHARFVAGQHPVLSLASVQIPAVGDSIARMFLVNPSVEDGESMLDAIVRLAREVGPPFLLRLERQRLRSQVRTEERALLARELHDGVIQWLLALRIRTHLLKRRAGLAAPAGDLALIEEGLSQQVVALRELTERLRPRKITPAELLNRLQTLVERFSHETRVTVTFSGNVRETLPAPTGQEIVRIVEEALANIRRHSKANSASVRLKGRNHHCVIEIRDDGQGFPFTGRLTLNDLDRRRQGPRVIKECVRNLGGELTIDSGARRGSRLEIRIPLSAGYAVA